MIQTLYPVLTRAEAASERFRRFAATLLQGVLWICMPAAAFLAFEAPRFVDLLYGASWVSVTPLLPYAAALMALRGFYSTLNQVMLANLQQSACIALDITSAIALFAIILFAMSHGVITYLAASIVQTIVVIILGVALAARGSAINIASVTSATISCLLATGVALAALSVIQLFRPTDADGWLLISFLFLDAMLFGAIYVAALRVLNKRGFALLLDALPLPPRIRRIVCIATALPTDII